MKVILAALLLSVLAFGLGCSTQVRKRPQKQAAPAAVNELKQAEALLKKGQKTKAMKMYVALAKKYPNTNVGDESLFQIGRYQFDRQDFEKAFEAFIRIVNPDFDSPRTIESGYYAAVSAERLGRFQTAFDLIEQSLKSGPSPAYRLQLLNKRYELARQLGVPLEALDSLAEILTLEKDATLVRRAELKARDIIDTELSFEQLSQLVSDIPNRSIRAFGLFRLGSQLFELKEFDSSEDMLSDALILVPKSDWAETASDLLAQIRARKKVEPRTIGVVLPLTGPYSKVAYKTLRGLQLGLGVFGEPRSGFRLAIMDSEGNPDVARRAVERLVTEDHVIAVVGSLLSKTASAVATKADELGVPNITFSQKTGLTEIGSRVFRHALTGKMQIRRLVSTAINQYGMKRFAVLYPNDQYGIEYTNLFWDEVLAQGGSIVGAQTYNPGETDFSGPIQRLVGTYYLEDRMPEYQARVKKWFLEQSTLTTRKSPPSDLLPPVIEFDGLFIPDSAKVIGQIGPTLAYHDVNKVRLLGTNIWHTKSLVSRGDRFVEAALFVDGALDFDVRHPGTFYDRYNKVYQMKPNIFEAQAYDVGVLLRELVASGARNRRDLADRLMSVDHFDGAFGVLRMSPKRELLRPLTSYTVKEGQITVIQ